MSSGILYTPPTPQRHGKFKTMNPDLQSKLPTPPPSLEWHNRVPDMDASNNPFLSRSEINGDVTSASTSSLPQQFFDHDNPFWNDSEPTTRQHADPAMKDSITYVFRGKKITYDTHGEDSLGAGPRLLWPSAETSQPRGRKRSAPSDSEEDAASIDDEPVRSRIAPQQTRRRASPRPVSVPVPVAVAAPAAIFIPTRSPPRRRASSSPSASSENDMPESHPSHPNIALAAPIVIASRPPPSTGRQVAKQAKMQLNEVTLRASMAKRNKLISALDDGTTSHGSTQAAIHGSGGSLARGFR